MVPRSGSSNASGTGDQMAVASELRRRLAAALVRESIGTGRWDTPLPIVGQPVVSAQGA